MKISLWPSNTIEFIKRFKLPSLFICIVIGAISLLIFAIGSHFHRINQIKAKHPIGSHVIIKGIGVEGTIEGYEPCGCDVYILTVKKDGSVEKVSVDTELLENL